MGIGHKEFTEDGEQVYKQALMYLLTKDKRHAENALAIIEAWAGKCTAFEGDNAPLEIGWGTASMARGLEILKHRYPEYRLPVEQKYIAFADKILMPKLTKRIGWTNNWQITICEARLQLALLREDRTSIDWAEKEFMRIVDVYVLPNGRTQETKRDMIHAQFGIGGLIHIAELFYHQGKPQLYAYKSNLLQKMVEYHAGILNGKVPSDLVATNISQNWFIPTGWEIALHHYTVRKGISKSMPMPETTALLNRNRPEKYTFHWGCGTLTHYLPNVQKEATTT